MRLGIGIKKNDFKVVIEHFTQYMNNVAKDIENLVKSW